MDIKITQPFDMLLKDNPEIVSHLRRKYKTDFIVMDKKVFHYDIAGETVFAHDYVLKQKISVRTMKPLYMGDDKEAANKAIVEMIEHIFEEVLDIASQSREDKIFLYSLGGGKISPNKDTLYPECEIIVKGVI